MPSNPLDRATAICDELERTDLPVPDKILDGVLRDCAAADEAESKECVHCKRCLSIDHFGLHRSTRDGLQKWCKECRGSPDQKQRRNQLLRLQRLASPVLAQREKAWRAKNPEKVMEQQRRWRRIHLDGNPEKMARLRSSQRKWMKENRKDPIHAPKMLARDQLNRFMERLNITERGPCAICECCAAHKHHADYSYPLRFYWLCVKCHSAVHYKLRRGVDILSAVRHKEIDLHDRLYETDS
jgi:hypothetical protein